MRAIRLAVVTSTLAAVLACVPPPPPPPISGVSSSAGEFVLTYTAYDSSGFAQHCYANLPYEVALTDDRGVEYRAVTQAIATSNMHLFGVGCNPYFWRVRFWMECTPDCGGPQGLWTGADPGRVAMRFKREPSLAKIVLHVEASYAGAVAQGEKSHTLPTILCGANPTNGVRTCLFPM
jgi:hypothetical protein